MILNLVKKMDVVKYGILVLQYNSNTNGCHEKRLRGKKMWCSTVASSVMKPIL